MKKMKEMIKEADMLLIGIGEELSVKKAEKETIMKAYQALQKLIAGKPWFVVTLNTDDLIYDAGFSEFFVVAPCGSDRTGNVVTNEDYDESQYLPQWKSYMNYLSATLGKKLLILEFGVGMAYPGVIRMPFEKTVLMNQKAAIVRMNEKLAFVPDNISDRSLVISNNSLNYLSKLDNIS